MSQEGYESPIRVITKEIHNEITEKREDTIVGIISEEIGVEVDKKRLLAALNFDRTQYQEAYKKGYDSGYEDAENDILADILPIFGLDLSNFKKDDKKEDQPSD